MDVLSELPSQGINEQTPCSSNEVGGLTNAPMQVVCACGHFQMLECPPEKLQRFQVGVLDMVVETKHAY